MGGVGGGREWLLLEAITWRLHSNTIEVEKDLHFVVAPNDLDVVMTGVCFKNFCSLALVIL